MHKCMKIHGNAEILEMQQRTYKKHGENTPHTHQSRPSCKLKDCIITDHFAINYENTINLLS